MNDEVPVDASVGWFLSELTEDSTFLRREVELPDLPDGTLGRLVWKTRYYVRLRDFASWSDAYSFGPAAAAAVVVGLDPHLAGAAALLASLKDKMRRMTIEEQTVLASVAKTLGKGKYRDCLPITQLEGTATSLQAIVGSLVNKGILEFCRDGLSVRLVW